MKGETGERQKKLAKLYDRFFDDLGEWASRGLPLRGFRVSHG